MLVSLLVTTFILFASSILVMADEFKGLPMFLQHSSSMLAHNRQHRTFFICGIISLMAFTSIVGVLACPERFQPNAFSTGLTGNNTVDGISTRSADSGVILSFLQMALSDDSGQSASSHHTDDEGTRRVQL